jgi:hypothetical protein
MTLVNEEEIIKAAKCVHLYNNILRDIRNMGFDIELLTEHAEYKENPDPESDGAGWMVDFRYAAAETNPDNRFHKYLRPGPLEVIGELFSPDDSEYIEVVVHLTTDGRILTRYVTNRKIFKESEKGFEQEDFYGRRVLG